MGLTMRERQAVTKATSMRYRLATKKNKGVILDECVALTRYHRVYARVLLRRTGRPPLHEERRSSQRHVKKRPLKGKHAIYDDRVLTSLQQMWAMLDGLCGKRLAPALKTVVPVLEQHGEIKLDPETRRKLLTISPATIDRLLAPARRKLLWKGRTGTKPGSLLKHQIPVRTFADWDEQRPGFLECDLVGHDGGDARGDVAQTLNVTDVCTGWTETQAVKNKAQVWVFQAFQEMRARLPFDLLGVDSDNGGEFINNQMFRYCQQHRITFTRSRAYRKNDNCYVEQKNYSIVRKAVGYVRYDTDEEVACLNELYRHLRLFTNFFQPVMKLVKKTRVGSKVKKTYDTPQTPYQRVLDSSHVPEERKLKLHAEYAHLNPAHLKRAITRLQETLFKLARPQHGPEKPTIARTDTKVRGHGTRCKILVCS